MPGSLQEKLQRKKGYLSAYLQALRSGPELKLQREPRIKESSSSFFCLIQVKGT